MADRITRDGRVPPRDGDLRTAELMAQYLRPIYKRMEKKDSSTRALMANTYTAAVTVLDGLREVEFADLAMSVFAYCRDEKFRQFSKLYEGLLELAGAAPERFVMKLHPFYNDLAAKIKRDGSLYDYAQFLGAFSKLRYTKIMKVPGMNPSVIIAYTNLLIQSFDYLRPNKLDLDTNVVGVSTKGEALVAPGSWSRFSNLPALESFARYGQMGVLDSLVESFHRAGMTEVQTQQDVLDYGVKVRLYQWIQANMLPFINEYTFDIFPTQLPQAAPVSWKLIRMRIDVDELKERLLVRRRTLPSNGVRVQFEDETEQFYNLLLKEIVQDDRVVLLYKLSTDIGQFSGYYDTMDQHFFSILMDAAPAEYQHVLQAFVLYFYAVAVLDDPTYSDEAFTDQIENFIYKVKAKSYGMSGRLKNTYQPEAEHHTGARKGSDRYTEEERAINGYIRKLPAGQSASPEAVARAEKLGYRLAPDETYVAPFMKSVFTLRQEGPQKDKEPM